MTVREKAIRLLALEASNPTEGAGLEERARALGYSRRVVETACDAWMAVYCAAGSRLLEHEVDAEAECLLREGWSPGEPLIGADSGAN